VTTALAVAALAGVGALLRYLVDAAVQRGARTAFPWGTLVVNATGSFAAGLVAGLALRGALPAPAAVALAAGLASGYTTLSTWAWETWALAQRGERLQAASYAVGTPVACLALAGLGVLLTR
jgi:fluoride exporter